MTYRRNNGPGKVNKDETTIPAFAIFKIMPKSIPRVIETRYLEVSL
jgi:hypothetical protein